MILIVTGGRNFDDVPFLWRQLDLLDAAERIAVVVDGASDEVTGPYKGADYWAHQWGKANGRNTVRVYADWKAYGKAAGPIRNGRMLEAHKAPDTKLAAFDGNRGTEDCIRQAKRLGIEVIDLRWSGA